MCERCTSVMRTSTPDNPSSDGSRSSHALSSPTSTRAPRNMSPAMPLAGSRTAIFIMSNLIPSGGNRICTAAGMPAQRYDVAVIGGGPAGLCAALWLARYLHKVIVVDSGDPRNWETRGINGYLGHQGIRSPELRELGHAECVKFGVEFVSGVVDTAVNETGELFAVCLRDGTSFEAYRVLLDKLKLLNIPVLEAPIQSVISKDREIAGIELEGAMTLDCERLYFAIGQYPADDLGAQLGCKRDELGRLVIDDRNHTSVKNVYAAGDIAPGPQLAIVAAASGAISAIAIHASLLPEARMLPAP